MRRAALIAAVVLAGCGTGEPAHAPTATPSAGARGTPASGNHPAASATPVASATPGALAIAPSDRAACALLYTRLQRVTLALSSSSELIAQSVDERDLSGRIRTEQQQLERSARLLAAGVVPAKLAAANARLVGALRAFARDFRRAQAPAERGDFPAAVAAMTDKPVVQEILAAATTIENACHA